MSAIGKWRSILATLRFGGEMSTAISRRRLLFARVAAVSSFVAYIYSQVYVLYNPNPRIAKLCSPNDPFATMFFALSVLLNVHWLRDLFFTWHLDGDMLPLSFGWDENDMDTKMVDNTSGPHILIGQIGRDARILTAPLSSAQIRCLPFAVAGNIFMAMWGYAWANEHHNVSQLLLTANLASYLYAVFMLLHVENDDFITPINYMTHLVMKTGTGLAVLYMWKNWGVIDQSSVPSLAEMINSGVIFLLMTIGSGPDPTLGICLLYDLTALMSGERSSKQWHYSFCWFSVVVSLCLLIELKISHSNDFSWLKGFDGPSVPSRGLESGKIALEKDVEDLGIVSTSTQV